MKLPCDVCGGGCYVEDRTSPADAWVCSKCHDDEDDDPVAAELDYWFATLE